MRNIKSHEQWPLEKYSTKKWNNEHKHPHSEFMAQLILISAKASNSFICKVIKCRILWNEITVSWNIQSPEQWRASRAFIYLPFFLCMQALLLLYHSAGCHWFNDCKTLSYLIPKFMYEHKRITIELLELSSYFVGALDLFVYLCCFCPNNENFTIRTHTHSFNVYMCVYFSLKFYRQIL